MAFRARLGLHSDKEVVLTLGEIYDFFIREGVKADPRDRGQIQKHLTSVRRTYQKLNKPQKKLFDTEDIHNPYADSRILHGNRKKKIRRILIGIDIEVGELLLADQLSQRGKPIDLVMAHHPEGIALAGLHEVMTLQTDILHNWGVDYEVAQDLMKKRISNVSRQLQSCNHSRAVDAARLLDIPMMCCHTPADNHVAGYLQKLMNSAKPKTLQKIIDLLLKEPEYREAARQKAGPQILIGKPKDKAGKVFVDMTGGTEGSRNVFARLSQIGIKTQLIMHLSDAHFQRMRAEYLKAVNAGHMASDNLGMNLLLDKLEKRGDFDIICCSGFRRIRR